LELRADLALEGGGVKGIGLAGAVLALDEAGYKIQRVAGTSAGAIAASLIAALVQHGDPILELREILDGLDFEKFMPEGKLHHFMDKAGKLGEGLADAEILARRPGLYPGTYLSDWLTPILSHLQVETFANLKLDPALDPEMSLPADRRYRLVVHTSDISRGELVRLPWDYNYYGKDRDTESVVSAVRASMSIPFFFEPVTVDTADAVVDFPTPDGRSVTRHYEAGSVTWVDGGMLRNFPIDAFDRVDGGPPRWPTIGIKLSSFQTEVAATTAVSHSLGEAIRCVRTMTNEWDGYAVDASTAGRTIFVDCAGLTATDFDLEPEQRSELFVNGVRAATGFVMEMAANKGVPRTALAAARFHRQRLGPL
jgi:NTE family protein